MTARTPEWFTQAIDTPYREHFTEYNGCKIHYQTWGDPQNPGLLFLHGNGAHGHWWDFICPSFSNDYYVVALTLSGMGDSGHREHYSSTEYLHEIKAVSDAANFINKPLLIGHSMGGRLVFNAEQLFPDAFYGVIMADSPFHPPETTFDFKARIGMEVKPHRVYQKMEDAIYRFRLSPVQECENRYIMEYIAKHSLKATQGGWQWKFDPATYIKMDYETFLRTQLQTGNKVLAMIYGENSSLFTNEKTQYNQAVFKEHGLPDLISIPNAQHHLFLDQPLAFIAEIKKVLVRENY
ncbi:MAG: alpha/beta fold hydrolase [Cellvibrionaceae bacterium]